MASIGVVYLDVKPDTKGFGKDVEKGVQGELPATAGEATGSGWGKKLGKGIAVGAAAGFAAAGALAFMGIQAAKDMEQVEIAFQTTLGEKAPQFIADLKAFAAKTPFEFAGLAEAASRMTAVGVEADRVIPIMTTLGDATSAMGTGAEGIDRAVTALNQMQQKGKVTGEEMMQLTEAGIPAWDALAAVLGTDVAGAMDQVSKGGVKAESMFKALETGAGDALGKLDGMMAKQSQSLEGMLSTLKDTISMGLADLMTPLMPLIKEALGTISALIAQLMPVLQPIITALSSGFGTVLAALGPVIEKVLPPLAALITSIGETFFVAVGAIIPPLASLLGALAPLLEPIGLLVEAVGAALAPVLGELVTALVPVVETLVGALAPIVEALTPLIVDNADAFGEMLLALIPLLVPLAELIAALTPIIQLVATLNLTMINLQLKAITPLIAVVSQLVGILLQGLTVAINTVIGLFVNFGQTTSAIATGITAAWQAVVGSVGWAVDTIVGFVTGIPSRIAQVVATMWNGIKDGAYAAKNWVGDRIDEIVSFVVGIPGRIANSVKGMWDGIAAAFKATMNIVIGAWNSLEFRIPGFNIDLPGPLPSVSWSGFTLGVPDIPRLAAGGLALSPTLAFLAEREPEIVSPEALMRQIVREEAAAVSMPLVVEGSIYGVDALDQLLDERERRLARALVGKRSL